MGAGLAKQGLLKLGTGSISPILNGAVTGGVGGALGGAAAGFTGGFTSALLNGKNLSEAWAAGKEGIVPGALLGGAVGLGTGAYGGYKYAKANNLDPWTGKSLNNNSTNLNSNCTNDYNLPIGRRGNPMDARGTNEPTIINDRLYSGHALDQMQGRGFVPSVVENAINNPTTIIPGNTPGTIVYYGDVIRVVTNLNGDIITVIPQ